MPVQAPATVTAPTPIRQRRKEARPQELLDAALEVFVEKGFVAARAEEVAARAGVSKGTLYLYYPSKEELLKAVIRRSLTLEIEAAAEQVDAYSGPTATLLLDVFSAWWQRLYDGPASGVFKLMIGEVRGFPEIGEFYVREVIEPGHRVIGRIIERGIERGEFRAVEVSSVVHSLVLPMVMLCVHKHSFGACPLPEIHVDPREFIRSHLELILKGLALPSATRARKVRA
jgi:AcrR family transcriptional regulator